MSISNFVKSLLPRIERTSVAEDLRTSEKEYVKIVLPTWEAAATHFKIEKLASAEATELGNLFYRNFDRKGVGKAVSFLHDIQRRLPTLHENVVYLQGILDSEVERDIISEGMSARQAFIVRAASNLSLMSQYLSSLLNYVYTVEAQHHDTHLDEALQLSKAEQKYVENMFLRFVALLNAYSMPTKDFSRTVKGLPEVLVGSDNGQAISGAVGDIDPFEKFGTANFLPSVIYRVRLVIARWQNDRYESSRAKKQQLELRLLYLQMQKEEGTSDPTVMREISDLQARIEKYDRYLREVEESIEERR